MYLTPEVDQKASKRFLTLSWTQHQSGQKSEQGLFFGGGFGASDELLRDTIEERTLFK